MSWRSVIWIPIGLATARFGGRAGRRAALRGAMSIATAIGLGNAIGSLERPDRLRQRFPGAGGSSFTQPVIASAVAFTAATAVEAPRLVVPVGAAAGATVAWSCSTSDCGRKQLVGASLLGAAAALATVKVWPRTPSSDGAPSSAPAVATDEISSTGQGLSIVVNAAAGDPAHDDTIATIERELPDADVCHIDDVDQLEDELAKVARSSKAIGALGGDGTVGATARAAIDANIPLALFPGGTLNHFARDAGVDTVDDAVRAVQNRRLIEIDTGLVDGRTFVNTASLGSYSTLVELRERHEKQIGKWPAVVLALVEMLAHSEPFALTINGTHRRIWMIFVGNCSYEPAGFAPSARTQLDDGLFDVRIIDADHPFARTRLIAALLTGRLARSAVYSRALVDRLDIDVGDSTPLLAADGEVFAARAPAFSITKNPRPLRLFVTAE